MYKEHRYKWQLCTASSKENDKCTAVPVMMISYEWKTQVSLDAFGLLKTGPGGLGRGKRSMSNISFFLFLFKDENGTICHLGK